MKNALYKLVIITHSKILTYINNRNMISYNIAKSCVNTVNKIIFLKIFKFKASISGCYNFLRTNILFYFILSVDTKKIY